MLYSILYYTYTHAKLFKSVYSIEILRDFIFHLRDSGVFDSDLENVSKSWVFN